MLSIAQESGEGQTLVQPEEEDDDGTTAAARDLSVCRQYRTRWRWDSGITGGTSGMIHGWPNNQMINLCCAMMYVHWYLNKKCSVMSWKVCREVCRKKKKSSYEMLPCCICQILGAHRTKAKTKKKQWWRPWVDHASSRLMPQPPFFSSSTLIGPCVLDQNTEDSRTASGLWRHQHRVAVLHPDFSVFLSLFKGPRNLQLSHEREFFVERLLNVIDVTVSALMWSRVALNRHKWAIEKEKMTNGWRFVRDVV